MYDVAYYYYLYIYGIYILTVFRSKNQPIRRLLFTFKNLLKEQNKRQKFTPYL